MCGPGGGAHRPERTPAWVGPKQGLYPWKGQKDTQGRVWVCKKKKLKESQRKTRGKLKES